ncbi:ADP-ribosylation factor [Mycena venus]|uniref:Decapping nuclease n=1 Tax=Mycena venus TaxID=2733690 RepID=A0A8H6Z2S8_9AGAR|nr:ADP-ribosylation factor [Mycena venus]
MNTTEVVRNFPAGPSIFVVGASLDQSLTDGALPAAFKWLVDSVENTRAGRAFPPSPTEDPRSLIALEIKLESWLERAENDSSAARFLRQFETTSLSEWDHYVHVRIIYSMLSAFGRNIGREMILQGIQKYVSTASAEQAEERPFHFTMTYFWIQVVHFGICGMPSAPHPDSESGSISYLESMLDSDTSFDSQSIISEPASDWSFVEDHKEDRVEPDVRDDQESVKTDEGFDAGFIRFLLLNPHVIDEDLWTEYYSKELMMSPKAAARMVLPDKRRLPNLVGRDLTTLSMTSLSAPSLMSFSTVRLINVSDPPQCSLPALLGPAKQSACFSICNKRLEVDSTSALRYFVDPPPVTNANLREGLKAFMRLPFKDRVFKLARRLDNVFTMCLDAENSEELLKAEVVTWRGIMTKIMLGQKLDLNVSFYRGVLYLEEDCTRPQFEHKFETICSTRDPSGEPQVQVDNVDLHTLWNAAITRTLGSLNILLVGEVDCVKVGYSKSPGPEHYVELKTRKMEVGGSYTIPNKQKWTMQSHLLGTPEIFAGFPDSAGIVRSFKTFNVAAPPQHKVDWGARVLHTLRTHCAAHPVANGVLKVWRVQTGGKYVDVRELDGKEVKRLNKGGGTAEWDHSDFVYEGTGDLKGDPK